MGRLIKVAFIAVVLGLFLAVPAQGADPNLLQNGSFEEGFVNGVGNGWTAFSNGGHCNYGWHPDNWRPVVWDGQWSQLIEMSTGGQGGGDRDRYAGIYQTVDVVSGATYRLTIRGMVRSTEGSPAISAYGYRVQWAIDYDGGTDWQALEDCCGRTWKELPWYEWPRLSPGYFETFSTDVTATSDRMTLFIRAWKKWGTADKEGDYNLDGISLVGPAPGGTGGEGGEGWEGGEGGEGGEGAEGGEGGEAGELPETGAGLAAPIAGILLAGLALGARGMRAYLAKG